VAAAAERAQNADQPGARHQHGDRGDDHRREKKQQRDAPVAANANCSLVVPSAPTSAAGLATPYELVATDRGQGACHEANADQSAFVEAAVYDPGAHAVSIYHPLVVDRGDEPAVPPVPVTLPTDAVVGVWFGFNGDTLTLKGPGAGDCVNGLPGSPFGQFAYCNAAAFFAATTADATFQQSIPALATSPKDGLPCPTSRDFSVVDQDQSDNLATVYRIINGRMAQATQATADRGTALTNGSDEGLVARFIAPALGCEPFTAPSLTDGGTPTPALALNELHAAARQPAPSALVPTSDPMVQVDGKTSTRKTNLYRAGVGQPALPAGQSPREYCRQLQTIAPNRLAADAAFLAAAPSPGPEFRNLLTFLRDRLQGSLAQLGCVPVKGDGAGQHNGAAKDNGAATDNRAARDNGTATNSRAARNDRAATGGTAVATDGAAQQDAAAASDAAPANDRGSAAAGSPGDAAARSATDAAPTAATGGPTG
jgi:hypothetical protein